MLYKHFLIIYDTLSVVRYSAHSDDVVSDVINFCSDPNQTKVAYGRYDSPEHVDVALHLTNTVMVDRALILVPYPDGKVNLTSCHILV